LLAAAIGGSDHGADVFGNFAQARALVAQRGVELFFQQGGKGGISLQVVGDAG
jgi:hypothetical protein